MADLKDGFGLFTQVCVIVKLLLCVRNSVVFICSVCKESWIQHATLQENVLFGQPYKVDRYRAVIAATALEQVQFF